MASPPKATGNRANGSARPAPRIDRLIRVAHSRDRVRARIGAKSAAKELQLSVRGVLELIEQHGTEPGALG